MVNLYLSICDCLFVYCICICVMYLYLCAVECCRYYSCGALGWLHRHHDPLSPVTPIHIRHCTMYTVHCTLYIVQCTYKGAEMLSYVHTPIHMIFFLLTPRDKTHTSHTPSARIALLLMNLHRRVHLYI